jgi:hypothetical protein
MRLRKENILPRRNDSQYTTLPAETGDGSGTRQPAKAVADDGPAAAVEFFGEGQGHDLSHAPAQSSGEDVASFTFSSTIALDDQRLRGIPANHGLPVKSLLSRQTGEQ